VTRVPLVFLDANILFSAALGGPSFDLLLELGRTGRVRLVTSPACGREARTNLERKRSDRIEALDDLVLSTIAVVPVDAAPQKAWAQGHVDRADVHVLAAARALGADVLITGDVSHFGHLMERSRFPLRVRTVRAFLIQGP